jgi:REP element-mobilizing transposase RayT
MVKCEECYKYHNLVISKECKFCRDYSFNENILCGLLQEEHESYEVGCSAFKPNLSVIGREVITSDVNQPEPSEPNLTERHQWLKAYALQQWKSDDNQTFSELNYHLCLLTTDRKRLLQNLMTDIDKVLIILGKAGKTLKGEVSLLYIGVDHIHFHVNSSPDYSADEVTQKIMATLEVEMKLVFPDIFKHQETLFQKTYFIETMG